MISTTSTPSISFVKGRGKKNPEKPGLLPNPPRIPSRGQRYGIFKKMTNMRYALPLGAGKKLRYGSINCPANWALHFLRPDFLIPPHIGPWQIGPSKLSPQTEMEKSEKLERCKFLPKNSTENK